MPWPGTDIKHSLQVEISRRVALAAAKGTDIAKDDPLGLLNSSASVVLNDAQLEERSTSIAEGRAFAL